MPRGMDERFEDPSDEEEDENAVMEEETTETSSVSVEGDRETMPATKGQSNHERTTSEAKTVSSTSGTGKTDDKPLNIRKDWDSATIYVEPAQSEDITLEQNKHFYRGVFEVAFGEHREETKEKIRQLAMQDTDQ